jgi:hypothetical protein
MKRHIPSEVLSSEKDSPKLPRRPPMGKRPAPIADALNKQYQKPPHRTSKT